VATLLVVVALSAERRALLGLLTERRPDRIDAYPLVRGRIGPQPLWVLQAGLGRARARAAVLAASAREPLGAVWSLGFAGGLADRLRPGTLAIPSLVLGPDQTRRAVTDPSRIAVRTALESAALSVVTGPLITLDAPVRTPAAKRRLAAETGAVVADMEAAGVAAAAEEIGRPWLALKAVLDACDDRLPAALAEAVRPNGNLCWPGLARAVCAWPALVPLARSSRLAARRLGAALPLAVSAWAALTPPGLSSTMSAP
jgi:adenosylhomocysteine nucleosidase